jgi:hypothetical protein
MRSELAPLEADGFLERVDGELRPTRRWRAAMRRAAARLAAIPDAPEDLRVPVALALVERYGRAFDDETLARLVLEMTTLTADVRR